MPAEGTASGAVHRRPGFLVWLAALAAWLAFAPLRLRQGPVGFQLEPTFDAEMLGHLLLLVPLAVALAAAADGSARAALRVVLLVVAAAALFEAGQVFVDDRALSPYDFAAGVLGGLMAAAATRLVVRAGVPGDGIRRTLLAVMVTAAFVSVGLSARAHNRGLRLAGWNPRHVVVVADEFAGPNRAYAGTVSNARICAARDAERVCVTAGADAESRRRLVQVAESSQFLELSADIVSTSDEQNGPARIVTFSWGPYGRNVSLLQYMRSLTLRVRTPRTGPNGTLSQFILPRVVEIGVPTRVVATFDRGRIAIRARSETAGEVVGVHAAPFHATLLSRGRRAVHMPYVLRGRALTAATLVLFAGLGLATATLTRLGARWLLLAAAPAALLTLWLLSASWWSAPPPRLFEHAGAVGATLVGVLLGLWDRSKA